MFGSHLSIAGGMENALLEAQRLNMDCVQVFTKNQRQWQAPPLTEQQVARWQAARDETGIKQVVSHDSYLINLASPDPATWDKSVALFHEELVRCERLNIPWLVTHPGAHMKSGETVGLARVAEALDRLHEQLPGLHVVTCLEITAGQGTSLGHRLEQLQRIIDLVAAPQRLGVCLDTAHLLAAGYDLTSAAGAKQVIAAIRDTVGLNAVKVIHVNDSKTALGSRVDRHEHIGHGHVSLDAFEVFVNQLEFKHLPKILETPKADAPDGRPWDAINLDRLRSLVRTRKPVRKRK